MENLLNRLSALPEPARRLVGFLLMDGTTPLIRHRRFAYELTLDGFWFKRLPDSAWEKEFPQLKDIEFKHVGVYGPPGESLEGQWRHKAGGRFGHHHVHGSPSLCQPAGQEGGALQASARLSGFA